MRVSFIQEVLLGGTINHLKHVALLGSGICSPRNVFNLGFSEVASGAHEGFYILHVHVAEMLLHVELHLV